MQHILMHTWSQFREIYWTFVGRTSWDLQLRVPEQAIGELAEHIGAGGASFIQAVTCSFYVRWVLIHDGLETQSLSITAQSSSCNHMSIQDTLRGSKRSIHVWNRLDSIKLDDQIDKDMNVRNICTHIT